MEGRKAEEAYERACIRVNLTDEERAAGFRRELESLAEKWLVPEERRRNLRTALDFAHVVASDVYYHEVQRCALAQAALRAIVADAKDEGREDMRDSVDEQLIEEGRAILDGKVPDRYRPAVNESEGAERING